MACSKSSKRPHIESESDNDSDQLVSFPSFILLESLEEGRPLSKLSPFVIEKVISSRIVPRSVKKLRNGNLLVEVGQKAYSDILLKMTTFFEIKIKSYPHTSLNSSKGVVRSPELSLCTLDEIKTHLGKKYGVKKWKSTLTRVWTKMMQ